MNEYKGTAYTCMRAHGYPWCEACLIVISYGQINLTRKKTEIAKRMIEASKPYMISTRRNNALRTIELR